MHIHTYIYIYREHIYPIHIINFWFIIRKGKEHTVKSCKKVISKIDYHNFSSLNIIFVCRIEEKVYFSILFFVRYNYYYHKVKIA